MISTELTNPNHAQLDLTSTTELTDAFINDQLHAVYACQRASQSIANVVNAAVPRLKMGGRLIYVGAGTSGRLGLLDSVELYPTFSWPHERAKALLAGGQQALYQAIEGAEDDELAGATDLLALKPTHHDVVLLIAASGRTPYVLGALQAAKDHQALTVAVVNNADAPIAAAAQHAVILDTGPEVITGSTRLKAGTAQKIALNTLSSAIMVRLNKVHGNLMIDLKATNHKLVERATQLTMQLAQVGHPEAQQALAQCQYQVKVAVVMLKTGLSAELAQKRLNKNLGNLRQTLHQNSSAGASLVNL